LQGDNKLAASRIYLLAHSTGAYVIREAFDDADDNDQIAKTNWTVSQIALIAGDIASATLITEIPRESTFTGIVPV
jgi:esterase/lipase superfamily enzyme